MRLKLETLIDSMGLSIKPLYIRYWLEEYLEEKLAISNVQRDEIQLLEC